MRPNGWTPLLRKQLEGDRLEPLVWIVISSVILVLVIIAASFLGADYMRGALGGYMTLERAKSVLVVSTDDETRARAERWIAKNRAEHPDCETVALHLTGNDTNVFESFEQELKQRKPDAVVWSLHDEFHHSHEGPYAMAKSQLTVPMDAIYTSGETTAQKEAAAS